MKYLKFIFENEEVCNLTDTNQELINEATANIIYNSINLEQYVQENLDQFVSSSSSLAEVYEAIRDFAIQETVDLFSASSEVIKDPVLSNEIKFAILEGEEATEHQLSLMDKASQYKDLAKAGAKSAIGGLKSSGHDAIVAAKTGLKAAEDKISQGAASSGVAIMSRLSKANDAISAAIEHHPAAAVSALAAAVAGAGYGAYRGVKKYKANRSAGI